MIRANIRRAVDRRIVGFAISGHADFSERGSDIVCAGVSAVAIGTVNAIERLLSVDMRPEERDGYLRAAVPDGLDDELAGQVQLLLESLVVMLQGIETSYGAYVRLTDRIEEGG